MSLIVRYKGLETSVIHEDCLWLIASFEYYVIGECKENICDFCEGWLYSRNKIANHHTANPHKHDENCNAELHRTLI